MGFFAYLKSRIWLFLPFLFGFAVLQGFRTHDWAAAAGAFLVSAAFFTLLFALFGLVRAVVRRKPSHELTRLR